MRLTLWLLCGCALWAGEPNAAIRVDQVGYLTDAPKAALVAGTQPAREFVLKREADGKIVYRHALGEAQTGALSGDRVQAADFSAVKEPGRYYVEAPGVGRSYTFEIGPNVYERAYYLAMRAFYGQRCGTAVDLAPDFPQYKYSICHREGAWHASSGREGKRESAKGWHDAGDYGRYIVNSGITTGTLLWTWELFGKRVAPISLKIPESGNGTPDILNEIRWNLEWMLTMQDADGGVWHKQTSERFPDFIAPEADTTVSYVFGTGEAPYKSSCATADFAAVMAIAGRVYRPFDSAFARRASEAAAHAWTWLEAHPNVTFRNPKGVVTGAYGDKDCSDERLWAAAELWRTQGGKQYQAYFLENYARYLETIPPPSWDVVAPLALWSYALAPAEGANGEARDRVRKASLRAADETARRTAASPYHIAMKSDDYVWGSNGVAANYALQLVVANRIDPQRRYADAALDNLHYLLGRNTFSVSWVTWVGSNWYKHPHHRPSGADGIAEPWPGMLSGGPNSGRHDPILRKLPADLPPMKVWADEQASFASNEIAINWNAPLVFVLASTLAEGGR
jgi:endoglucanase